MRWKAAILAGLTAATIGLTFAPAASADHDRHCDRQWSRGRQAWHRTHPAQGWNGWSGGRHGDWYRYRWGSSRWYGPYDRSGGWYYGPSRTRGWYDNPYRPRPW